MNMYLKTIVKVIFSFSYIICLVAFIFITESTNKSDINSCLGEAFWFYVNFPGLGILILLTGAALPILAIKKSIPYYIFPIPFLLVFGIFIYQLKLEEKYYQNHCESLRGVSCVECVRR